MTTILMIIVIKISLHGDFRDRLYIIMDDFTMSQWVRERETGRERAMRTLSEQPVSLVRDRHCYRMNVCSPNSHVEA